MPTCAVEALQHQLYSVGSAPASSGIGAEPGQHTGERLFRASTVFDLPLYSKYLREPCKFCFFPLVIKTFDTCSSGSILVIACFAERRQAPVYATRHGTAAKTAARRYRTTDATCIAGCIPNRALHCHFSSSPGLQRVYALSVVTV